MRSEGEREREREGGREGERDKSGTLVMRTATIFQCLSPGCWSFCIVHTIMQARRKLSRGGAAIGRDVRGRAKRAKKFATYFSAVKKLLLLH